MCDVLKQIPGITSEQVLPMRASACLKALPALVLSLVLAGCLSDGSGDSDPLAPNDFRPDTVTGEIVDSDAGDSSLPEATGEPPVVEGVGDDAPGVADGGLDTGGSLPPEAAEEPPVADGDDGDTPAVDDGADPTPAPVSLAGSVVKGVMANAMVTALAVDGEGVMTLLDTVTTDSQGAYSLALPDGFSGVVKLLVTASTDPENPTLMRCDANPGCGTHPENSTGDTNIDGVIDFGEFHPVGEEFALRAVVVVSGSGPRIVNVTPLSTLAADWAAEFPQGLDAQSVDAANAQAAALFGFALTTLNEPLSDIADPMWLNLASTEQVKLSLLMATFAQIASQYDINPQFIIDEASRWFVGQQGRLAEASDNPYEPSVAMFTNVSLVLAGVVEMPPATQEEVTLALAGALDGLRSGVLSAPLGTVDVTELMLGKLGGLGVQLDELLTRTGLRDPVSVANAQVPYFDWLFTSENVQLVPLGIETVVLSLLGSMILDMPETTEPVVIGTAVIDPVARTLRIAGDRNGQLVDITVSLTGLRTGIAAQRLDYGISGAIWNPVATGEINGTLLIDLRNTDTAPLLALLDMILNGTTDQQLLADVIHDIGYGLNAQVAVEGNAWLRRNSDESQVLGISGTLQGSLDLAAPEGATIAALDVPWGQIVLPNGDRLYGLPDVPVLSIVVGDDATLVVDGAATLSSLNLPEAVAHADGVLVNSRALFEHIRGVSVERLPVVMPEVVQAIFSGSLPSSLPETEAMLLALLEFDINQLALHGEGEILIPDLGHQYRARLDNLTATIYQPYSDEVAATATLDIEGQGVDLRLGTEPWRISVLTTPTPRLVLLGPSGEFAEATQEDFFQLLDLLPVGDLFAGLLPE